jgi:peptide/nickel transport system permease protein
MKIRSFFLRRFVHNRAAVFGLFLLVVVVATAILGPLLYPVNPFDMVGRPFSQPFGKFPLGTDVSGRDILAGIIHGSGISLIIGCSVALAASLIGVTFGAIAGYYGGWIDDALMRSTEYFLTIPLFAFALIIVAIFTPSMITIITAITVVSWPSIARLIRGEFASHRDREYVQACRAMGMGDLEIIFKQILPNTLPTAIVIGSLMVANAILTEAGISFLGLSDPNYVTWGYMLGVARTAMSIAPWMIAIPGLAILVTVLAINLVGEGLNDAFNPKINT